jgi:hypothetical protein
MNEEEIIMKVTKKDLLLLIERVNKILQDPIRNKIVLPGGCKPKLEYTSYPYSKKDTAHLITLTYHPHESPFYIVIRQIEYGKHSPFIFSYMYHTLLNICCFAKRPVSLFDMAHGTYIYPYYRPYKPDNPNLWEYLGVNMPIELLDGYNAPFIDLGVGIKIKDLIPPGYKDGNNYNLKEDE